MFKKDSVLVGILAGLCLPALVLVGHYLVQQQWVPQKSNSAYYLGAIALNLLALRFAYTSSLDRTARGLMASSFVICVLVFYLSKHALWNTMW